MLTKGQVKCLARKVAKAQGITLGNWRIEMRCGGPPSITLRAYDKAHTQDELDNWNLVGRFVDVVLGFEDMDMTQLRYWRIRGTIARKADGYPDKLQDMSCFDGEPRTLADGTRVTPDKSGNTVFVDSDREYLFDRESATV